MSSDSPKEVNTIGALINKTALNRARFFEKLLIARWSLNRIIAVYGWDSKIASELWNGSNRASFLRPVSWVSRRNSSSHWQDYVMRDYDKTAWLRLSIYSEQQTTLTEQRMNWESSCVDLFGSLDRFRGSTWPGFYVLFVSVDCHLTGRNLHEDSINQSNELVTFWVADQLRLSSHQQRTFMD